MAKPSSFRPRRRPSALSQGLQRCRGASRDEAEVGVDADETKSHRRRLARECNVPTDMNPCGAVVLSRRIDNVLQPGAMFWIAPTFGGMQPVRNCEIALTDAQHVNAV